MDDLREEVIGTYGTTEIPTYESLKHLKYRTSREGEGWNDC